MSLLLKVSVIDGEAHTDMKSTDSNGVEHLLLVSALSEMTKALTLKVLKQDFKTDIKASAMKETKI